MHRHMLQCPASIGVAMRAEQLRLHAAFAPPRKSDRHRQLPPGELAGVGGAQAQVAAPILPPEGCAPQFERGMRDRVAAALAEAQLQDRRRHVRQRVAACRQHPVDQHAALVIHDHVQHVHVVVTDGAAVRQVRDALQRRRAGLRTYRGRRADLALEPFPLGRQLARPVTMHRRSARRQAAAPRRVSATDARGPRGSASGLHASRRRRCRAAPVPRRPPARGAPRRRRARARARSRPRRARARRTRERTA